MSEAEIIDINNKAVEKIQLSDSIFGLDVRNDILHTAVVNYLSNQRQGTHATKTRSMVRGGGRKPWKQKKTGRARHGSIRSPLWKGGGVTFGPQTRSYYNKLPVKFRRLALKTALSAKYSENKIIFVENISLEKPKTRDMLQILKGLDIYNRYLLIVLPDKDENVILSARNIVGVNVIRARDMNTYDILVHEFILITKDALSILEEFDNEIDSLDN